MSPRVILAIRRSGGYRKPVIGLIPLALYAVGLISLGWVFDRKMPWWIGRS